MVRIKYCKSYLKCNIYGFVRTFLSVLANTLVLLTVSFVLVTTFKTVDPLNKGYKTQDFFGFQLYSIASNSMYPTINVGDGVMIKIADESTEIKEGDVVAYRLGEHIIVHRVKDIVGGDSYLTQGDANDTDDGSPIPRERIVGRMIFLIPRVAEALEVVRTPIGFVLFFIFVLAMYMFFGYAFRIPDVYFGYSDEELSDEDEEEK